MKEIKSRHSYETLFCCPRGRVDLVRCPEADSKQRNGGARPPCWEQVCASGLYCTLYSSHWEVLTREVSVTRRACQQDSTSAVRGQRSCHQTLPRGVSRIACTILDTLFVMSAQSANFAHCRLKTSFPKLLRIVTGLSRILKLSGKSAQKTQNLEIQGMSTSWFSRRALMDPEPCPEK